jgi:hypothetical protein
LGCLFSSYGPFSLGTHFETYEPFISSTFYFFAGVQQTQITETTDTESVDMGV